jgi:hypothetical protein
MMNNNERLTAVWQNGGFSAKFNSSSSIELLCKTEHLCFDLRHFAKLQTVECHCTIKKRVKKSPDLRLEKPTLLNLRKASLKDSSFKARLKS